MRSIFIYRFMNDDMYGMYVPCYRSAKKQSKIKIRD